jgi:DNA polymerase-3 subunit epsilon
VVELKVRAVSLRPFQPTLDDLGTPLSQITFVVVDLETNGGPNHEGGITEIGAVKIKGGEILSEFQTLVNPLTDIPPFIELLTGISKSMVADAPTLETVLPMFWDWAQDAALVAHNAPFDIGFLKAANSLQQIPWHQPQVVDTVTLARALVSKDEVPNRKLGTLAAFFGSPTEPVHRALADARATVHVFHALLERAGSFGVTTIEDLKEIGTVINARHRQKRHLAADLPDRPGVYIFRDDKNRTLYVGKSKSLRKRVATYFTKSEQRSRMARMLDLTESVSYIECATELEASVREFRIIQEQKPMFNRSGIRSESNLWLRLTKEAFPRLSVVRQVRPDLGLLHLGPLRSREKATLIIDAITSVIPIRTCTPRLSTKKPTSACALAEIGRCSAPCELLITPLDYQQFVDRLQASAAGSDEVQPWINSKIQELARAEKFEEAAVWRDRLGAWISAVSRSQRLTSLVEIRELVAAFPLETGGWDIHVIRHGALAASTHVKDVDRVVDSANSLRLSAQVFETPAAPSPANTIVEANLILKWLTSENVRLIAITEPWKSPWPSQQSQHSILEDIYSGRAAAHEVAHVRKPVAYNPPK